MGTRQTARRRRAARRWFCRLPGRENTFSPRPGAIPALRRLVDVEGRVVIRVRRGAAGWHWSIRDRRPDQMSLVGLLEWPHPDDAILDALDALDRTRPEFRPDLSRPAFGTASRRQSALTRRATRA